MIDSIIAYSIRNKFIILLGVFALIVWGLWAVSQLPIDAVPDITNNQVQVITTTRNLSTEDVEQFLTYPVELEMANLPGVQEIRSISKFGLSVVTIVFDDELGTYLPRQLIAEKIKTAQEKIPQGFGTPEMGPITTGLGEIYQYILDTKPGYEDKYSTMELRSIQDWIVKRQLSGIPGVVEVNTWGGFLKQFEVSIDPQRLKSAGVSISEIFQALKSSNSIAGGGYIQKSNQSYFIRGEGMLKNIQEIKEVVVKTLEETPILIGDVAEVLLGHSSRFGAITGNGEGEKVMGQIMLIKDGDSKNVLEAVKERVAEVQKSLPEGVYINPFLERSELIDKTIFTVSENLVLGALIVVFVVVLLLGNFRSGMLIASIIPLSLLFALAMMKAFGISANLMSLGAIDFGIIIDGAVIIVEYVIYHLTMKGDLSQLSGYELQKAKDDLALKSSGKMMHSAIFGQIIILIVFIPILTLTGVEGKMFKPMAMTFSFALIGAMILCLTYIPVMASVFLKPVKKEKTSFSEKLLQFITSIYEPVIQFALKSKILVLVLALVSFFGAMLLFSNMGGEFVPTLDEGDLVIQPVLKTGTSLDKTIDISTKIEKVLLENFDEVLQVVSRIGAAEVPTDPMSMEETDVIIKLKPIKEWVNAHSKDELIGKMEEALSILPGIEYEFTQPIEMRFNELITGVRTDIAIKIFGEDLDLLYNTAVEVKNIISDVEGAEDINVDKTVGLPQILVKYDRAKIARYGLFIDNINEVLQTAFAGTATGSIFEGERRFDLVVRLNKDNRKDIENVKSIYIDLPTGSQIPLSEVADISYTTGPAKISREDTKRRIVIGVNVRNRDMESVVEDIQMLLDEKLKLPPGYHITYGGQVENLASAKKRLMMVVPIALILIFIMLYFTFGSVVEAALVYSAIPLAAMGGILLLWLRDMPFSISAGVGFIALFGIAVLNGIVLIEHFKELKNNGMENIEERILKGTKQRLRPVLLTASAAALGFFPMAISTSSGAEVQRPLATVVIGGLVTATILTMVVLPVLYSFVARYQLKYYARKASKNALSIVLLITLFNSQIEAQTTLLSMDEAIQLAFENHPMVRKSNLELEQQKLLRNTGFNPAPTSLSFESEGLKSDSQNEEHRIGINQTFQHPRVYRSLNKINQAKVEMVEQQSLIVQNDLKRKVRSNFYEVIHLKSKLGLLEELNKQINNMLDIAQKRYDAGESNSLELLSVKNKRNQSHIDVEQTTLMLEQAKVLLSGLVGVQGEIEVVPPSDLQDWESRWNEVSSNHPMLRVYDEQSEVMDAQLGFQKAQLLPSLGVGYTSQIIQGEAGYHAVGLGLNVPLFRNSKKRQLESFQMYKSIVETGRENQELELNQKLTQYLFEIKSVKKAMDLYEQTGRANGTEMMKAAQLNYEQGAIDYLAYLMLIDNVFEQRMDFLIQKRKFQQLVILVDSLFNE